MELFDFSLIVNTAIGTAIGGVIATFLFLPSVIAWRNKVLNWKGWKKIVALVAPFIIVALLFALSGLMFSLGSYYESKAPGFSFYCQGDCEQPEKEVVENCSYVGNLYANQDTRDDVYKDPTLRSMLPADPPEPKRLHPRAKESRFPTFVRDLAERAFFSCMRKSGYSADDCTTDKPCFQIRTTTFYGARTSISGQGLTFNNGIKIVDLNSIIETD